MPPARQLRDQFRLLLGQKLGMNLREAQVLSNCLGHGRAIAGQENDLIDTQRPQIGIMSA